jgi:hypothetical protein
LHIPGELGHPQRPLDFALIEIDDDGPLDVDRRRRLVAVRPAAHLLSGDAIARDIHFDVLDAVLLEPGASAPARGAPRRAIEDDVGHRLWRSLRRGKLERGRSLGLELAQDAEQQIIVRL